MHEILITFEYASACSNCPISSYRGPILLHWRFPLSEIFHEGASPQSSTSKVASQCATRVANTILASKRCRDRLPRLCDRAISSIKNTVDADIAGTTTVGVSLCMNICLDAHLVEMELVAESFKVARDVALDLFVSPRWHMRTMTRRAYSSWAEDLCERRLDGRQACVDDSQGRLQDV